MVFAVACNSNILTLGQKHLSGISQAWGDARHFQSFQLPGEKNKQTFILILQAKKEKILSDLTANRSHLLEWKKNKITNYLEHSGLLQSIQ